MRTPSSTDWFIKEIASHINLDAPGIYEWRIGDGVYVGKSKRLRARLNEYPNNVRKLAQGLPYRKGNPDGFRAVHRKLHGHKDTSEIKFSVLENCSVDDLNARERFWINRRREEAKAEGTQVLNAD